MTETSNKDASWSRKPVPEWTAADHEAAWLSFRPHLYEVIASIILSARLAAVGAPVEMAQVRESLGGKVLSLADFKTALAALGWPDFWESVVVRFQGGSETKFRSHVSVYLNAQLITGYVPEPLRETVLAEWLCMDPDVFHQLRYLASWVDAFTATEVRGVIASFCGDQLAGVIHALDPAEVAWTFIKVCFRNWTGGEAKARRSQRETVDIEQFLNVLKAGTGDNTDSDALDEECDAECRAHLQILPDHDQSERRWRTALRLFYDIDGPRPPLFVDDETSTPRLVIDRTLCRLPVHASTPLRIIVRTNSGDVDASAQASWATSDTTVAQVARGDHGATIETAASRGMVELAVSMTEPKLRSALDVSVLPRNQWIAEQMEITPEHVALLLWKGRQRLRELLSRYPVAMTLTSPVMPIGGNARLELALNRKPYWDTLVALKCAPAEAVPDLQPVTFPAGASRWQIGVRAADGIHLLLSTVSIERTAPGVALIRLRRAQCDITAVAAAGELSASLDIGHPPTGPSAIELAGDTSIVVPNHAAFPPLARVVEVAGETSDLTSPVLVSLDHDEFIGGEDVGGRAILGGVVTASTSNRRMTAYLPLGSRAGAISFKLRSSGGEIAEVTRRVLAGRREVVFRVASAAVSTIVPATITAANTRGEASAALSILPPLIDHVRLSSNGTDLRAPTRRVPSEWIVAGAPLTMRINLTRAVVADTALAVRWNHSGVHAPEHGGAQRLVLTIPKGEASGQLMLLTDLVANAGPVDLRIEHVRPAAQRFHIVRNAIARINLARTAASVGTPVEGSVELEFESPAEIPIRLRTEPAVLARARGAGNGEVQVLCGVGGKAAPFVVDTLAVGEGGVEIIAELFESSKTVTLTLTPPERREA